MTGVTGVTGTTGRAQPQVPDGGVLSSPWRFVAVPAAMVAAAAHLPVMPEHLQEAPYMGVLFLLFTLAALAAGAAVLLADTTLRYVALGGLGTAAVLAYAATRLVAFPQLRDDVGDWWETWGVVSVAGELVMAAACAAALRAGARAS